MYPGRILLHCMVWRLNHF